MKATLFIAGKFMTRPYGERKQMWSSHLIRSGRVSSSELQIACVEAVTVEIRFQLSPAYMNQLHIRVGTETCADSSRHLP